MTPEVSGPLELLGLCPPVLGYLSTNTGGVGFLDQHTSCAVRKREITSPSWFARCSGVISISRDFVVFHEDSLEII